jgi:hypothetical protein
MERGAEMGAFLAGHEVRINLSFQATAQERRPRPSAHWLM